MSDILDALPVMTKSPCKDCGSDKWTSCNPHPDGGFYQCSECHKYDPDTESLLRVQ